jgi:hypothetical protein
MGSITFQVIGDASVGTRTKTYTVPDEHINRFVAWAKANFGETTAPQALLAWADLMMTQTRENVINYERAISTVPPFEAT